MINRMKVLWLGHNLAYPPMGGALQRNFNLLREISKSCEVHVLAFDQRITRPENVSPGDCVRALLEFCATAHWVSLDSQWIQRNRYMLALRGMLSGKAYDFAWLQSEEMERKLAETVASVNPDLVHVDTLGLAQYLPILGRRPTALNHHDVESCKIAVRAKNAGNPISRAYFTIEAKKLAAAERNLCPQFGVNAVVSENEGVVLRQSSPLARIRVVPNGVDTKFFAPRTDPGGHKLLFCGSMDMHPNQEAMEFFLRRIWPLISAQVPDCSLDIVGRKPPQWLVNLAQKYSRVQVMGFVEDVRPYFERSALCVSPIVSGGGTRLKILDSLAMGVPVVSTPFAASGLELEHGRHIILAETEKRFAEQTVRLLLNPAERVELARSGAECVDRLYSWVVVGQALLAAYDVAVEHYLRSC